MNKKAVIKFIKSSVSLLRNLPITEKVRKNIMLITAIKDGTAVYLPVKILSACTLLICSLLS